MSAAVSGIAAVPTKIIALSGNLAFGNLTVNTTATATLTISNTGNTALTVSSITYPSGFNVNWSLGTIPAGGSQPVTVTFAPTAVQSYGGTVTVNSDKTSGTYTIAASGVGTAVPTKIIGLSGNLAFGNVTVNTTQFTILTISNTGNTALTVSSITYPSGFSGPWSGTIPAGGSQPVTATFVPTAVQSYGGTVTVNSDKTSGTYTIAASGVGIAVPTKIIGLSGNLAFGNVTVNTTATATLTIANTGNTALTVSSISYPSGFSGTWSGTIAGGGSQPVTVTFAPTVAQSYSGTVTVNSDKTSGTNTIDVSGMGTVPVGETLNFNDNQLPPGWQLYSGNYGAGGFADGRMNAYATDAAFRIYRAISLTPGTARLEIKYRGNTSDGAPGGGNYAILESSVGDPIQISHGWGSNSSSGQMNADVYQGSTSLAHQSMARTFEEFAYTIAVKDGQISHRGVRTNGEVVFDYTVTVPGLLLSQINRIDLGLYVTRNPVLWMDDVQISMQAADPAPAFTAQPSDQTVIAGGSASFTAAALGTPVPTLQWQLSTDSGSTWTNLGVTSPYSGTTTGTLTISGTTTAMNGYQYRCLASNSVQSNAPSIAVTLTVNTAPAFTTQPTSQTVTAGGATTFTVAASGNPAPTFQWQMSTDGGNTWSILTETAPYSGTVTATLTITGAAAAMNGYEYQCLTSNSVQSNVASSAAALTVAAPPVVTTQPLPQTVTAGGDATFRVANSGDLSATYQWQVSTDGGITWTNLTDNNQLSAAARFRRTKLVFASADLPVSGAYSGTNTGALTITGATAAMNSYEYRCLISNSAGTSVASNAVVLTVLPSAASAEAGQGVISSGFQAVWNSVTGATGYRLDVSSDSSFGSFVSGYQNLDVGNVTSATLSGLNSSTTYYYRVWAYDSAGTGANSSTITVTTSAPAVITTPLTMSTLAGQPLTSGSADGTGTGARFYYPSGVAADNAGNLYLADTDNHTIRKIVASTGVVTTLAGLAGASGIADGTGTSARFNSPSGVAVDGAGNVYVADTLNHTLRKVTSTGAVTTLAGHAGVAGNSNGTGTAALLNAPEGLAIDSGSNLFVADTNNHTIRKVVPSTGVVTTVAGLAGNSGSGDGLGSAARFNFPSGVAVDGTGNLFVADTENHTIRKILSSGSVSTVAGLASSSGGADGTGSAARFDSPSDLAVDSVGNLYVADTDNFTIRKVVVSTGTVTTLAGLAGTSGSADGSGAEVRFFMPSGIAVDGSGNLFIADTNNDTIRLGLLPTAPVITSQPQSQTVTAGSSVQFSVTATGRPTPTYQWNFNGSAISGATGSSYSISSAQSGNAGNYTVTVSNSAGSATSNQAALTVNAVTPPPSGGGGDTGGGGGGGGGAPSLWFVLALALLAFARWTAHKQRHYHLSR